MTRLSGEDTRKLERAAMGMVEVLLRPPHRFRLNARHEVLTPCTCPSHDGAGATQQVEVRGHEIRPAGPCVTSRCGHFNNGCTLGMALSAAGARVVSKGREQRGPCGISGTCRWYLENGLDACQLCDMVTRHGIFELIANLEEPSK